MRLLLVVFLVILSACAPRLSGVDPEKPPSATDWAPKAAPMEWWYVSAYLPKAELAFHYAFFKAYAPERMRVYGLPARLVYPYPLYAAHLAVTDLKTGKKVFLERSDLLDPNLEVVVRADPLFLKIGDWRLEERKSGFYLSAGPLELFLTPLKPPVVHPPGYSGTEETGRMYYVSYTRLWASGRALGREVKGYAWMDHQWGEQAAGRRVGWDWFGLHLSDYSELMIYRVRQGGEVKAIHASRVDPFGRVEKLKGVKMTPLRYWTSEKSGYRYAVAWRVEAEELFLELFPLRLDQELLTLSTRVAYWEGPVRGEGEVKGHRVEAHGMGEFVGGPWPR